MRTHSRVTAWTLFSPWVVAFALFGLFPFVFSLAASFTDYSPIDEQPLGEIARGGEREADLAVRAATEAFPAWAALGAAGRAVYLHRLADLIDENVERLAPVECVDMAMLLRSLKARIINREQDNRFVVPANGQRIRAQEAIYRWLSGKWQPGRAFGQFETAAKDAVVN